MAESGLPVELEVLVMNTQQVLFEGKAKSVTSRNDKGSFDILPYHTNFITIVHEIIIINNMDGGKKEIPIDTGVMKVRENRVEIFLGI